MTERTKGFHSSATAEHYTPGYICKAARAILGYIGLDPASCAEANETVQAGRYYTADDDGLAYPWVAPTVFLNPPGTCGLAVCGNEKVCSCNLVERFWHKLVAHYIAGDVGEAIWVGFSVQQLQTLQTTGRGRSIAPYRNHPLRFPVCYPNRRVAYCGKSPPHASYIAYLGDNEMAFEAAFADVGHVVTPNTKVLPRLDILGGAA